MKPMKMDPAIYVLKDKRDLIGLNDNYVDDLLHEKTKKFSNRCRQMHDKFEMKEEDPPFNFAGCKISGKKGAYYNIDHEHYSTKLWELPIEALMSESKLMHMKIAWIGFSRPYCSFEITKLAQVTDVIFKEKYKEQIKHLKKSIRYSV